MTRFRVLPGSSSVDTEVRSSVHPIHGQATELRGVIEAAFDGDGRPLLDQPHSGWVEVPVEAIRSGNRFTEIEMQRRADVRRYPTIRFELDRAWQVDGGNRYRAALSVTAHGRTHPIEEDFSLRRDGRRLVLEGRHTFDMRDFGVNPPRILTLRVDPRVDVRVRLVADEED
ncbi:MAG TPA: YceI family protein [Candidatus Dormibacteraeota bacterium]